MGKVSNLAGKGSVRERTVGRLATSDAPPPSLMVHETYMAARHSKRDLVGKKIGACKQYAFHQKQKK